MFSRELAIARLVLARSMYYLRTKAATDAIKFTVDQQSLQRKSTADAAKAVSETTVAAPKAVGAA